MGSEDSFCVSRLLTTFGQTTRWIMWIILCEYISRMFLPCIPICSSIRACSDTRSWHVQLFSTHKSLHLLALWSHLHTTNCAIQQLVAKLLQHSHLLKCKQHCKKLGTNNRSSWINWRRKNFTIGSKHVLHNFVLQFGLKQIWNNN